MLRDIFKKVKDARGLTGASISEETGISQNHISRYLNGQRDIGSDRLTLIIEAMEKLSPGAKQDFARLLAGGDIWGINISLMSEQEKKSLMHSLIDNYHSTSVKIQREEVFVK